MTSTELAWAGAAIAAGIVFGAIAGRLARRTLGGPDRRPSIRSVAGPTGMFLFWISTATGFVVAVAASSPGTLEPLPTGVLRWLPNALAAGIILIVGYTIAITVSAAVGRAVDRASGHRQALLERTVRLGIVGGSVVLALGQLGIETTILNILVAAAAFGAAAALAGIAIVGSRSMSTNVAAGRAVSAFLAPGDMVTVNGLPGYDGAVSGTLTELATTHSILRTGDDRDLIIPNSFLADLPIESRRPT